jgi:DNA-binding Lrp family transcriptional regulator
VVPDLAALSRILNEVFLRHESVQHVHSSIVLHGLKETSALPLAHLVEETPHSGKAARRKR